MLYYIKAIGILMVAAGAMYATRPLFMRRVIDFFEAGYRGYIGGAIRIILGALLFWAAWFAKVPLIPGIIGAVMVVSGVTVFLVGRDRIVRMLEWWKSRPDGVLRGMAVFAALLGVLLIYST